MSTSVDVANPAISIHPVSSPLGDTSHIWSKGPKPSIPSNATVCTPGSSMQSKGRDDASMGMGSKMSNRNESSSESPQTSSPAPTIRTSSMPSKKPSLATCSGTVNIVVPGSMMNTELASA